MPDPARTSSYVEKLGLGGILDLLDRVRPVFIGMGHYRRVGIPSRGRDLPLTAYICEEVEGTVLSGTFPLLTEAYIFTPHPALEYWTLYYCTNLI